MEWFDSIRDAKTRIILVARLARIRLGNFGECGSSGENIQHIKIDYGPGYRIYFTQVDQVTTVLIGGGDKSSQSKDIKKAHTLWEENKNALHRFQRDVF